MIEKIKQSADFQNFIKEYNPFVIFLGGSRIYHYSSESSDWDLIAFTDHYHGPYRTCQRIVLKDLKPDIDAHILVVSLDMILDLFFNAPSHPDKLWETIGLMYNMTWSDKNIIYKTEIPEIFYELMNPENHIKEHVLHSMVVGHGDVMRHMLKMIPQGIFDIYYKIYYYFLVVWELYSGDRSYESLIKKIRTHATLDASDYEQYIQVLNKILKVAEDYDIFAYYNDYLYLEGLVWQHFQKPMKDPVVCEPLV